MLENWRELSGNGGVVGFQEFDGQPLAENLHEHGVYELCYLTKGRGEWQFGSVSGPFQQGSLLVCPPRTVHAWRTEKGVKASAIVVRFHRDALPASLLRLPEMRRLRDFLETMRNPLVFQVSDRERLRARLRSIDRAQGALRLARFYVGLELVSGFKHSQLSEGQGLRANAAARDQARLERVKRFVEEGFCGSLKRPEAAAVAGLEEAAFSRFFRRAMGCTFSEYLSRVRVRQAALLLGSRRDLELAEIARRSGFGSLVSMHRQFRKRLGTTPDSYRRAANAETLQP